MTPQSLDTALEFVEALWDKLGLAPTFLNIEYVGGEILLIDPDELTQMVQQTRARFARRGIQVRDGAQSNLIGSPRRVDHLYALFEGRVGTSIDRFSHQRTLGHSVDGAKRYRSFQIHVEKGLDERRDVVPPAVLSLDAKTLPFLMQELELSAQEGRDMTLRPIFQGGSEISSVSPEIMGEGLAAAFRWWVETRMPMHLEPFVSLLRRRCDEASISDNGFCAWQADCTEKSLSIEPNGDLYICQELADMDQLRLGNALTQTFDDSLYAKIQLRKERLDAGCFSCPYFKSCQGGCLQQSLEGGGGLYGKTQWCSAWKRLFKEMDAVIAQTGSARLLSRLAHVSRIS
jgi:radical SAM protein with 4Fe4S-binding SPASM domain